MTAPEQSSPSPTPTGRTHLWRAALLLVAVGALGVLAVVRAGRVYGGAFETRGTGAATGAVLLTAGAMLWRRWRPVVTALVAVAGLLGYLAVAVYAPSPLGLAGISDLGRHLLDGWATTLSVTVPVPDLPETTAFIVAALWIACTLAAGIALRAHRPVWSAVPLLVLHLCAVALEVGAGEVDWALVAASVAAFLALLVLAAPRPTDQGILGPGRVRAGLTVVACILAGVLLAPIVPGADLDEPYDPREQQVLEEAEVEGLNPLSLVRGWLVGEDRPLFTIDTPRPVDVQLAALDEFDGTGWTVQGSFRGAAGALPSGPDAPSGDKVDYRVELAADNPLAWLPTVPRVAVVEVSTPLLFERGTGNVLLAEQGPTSDRPAIGYRASSQVRAPDAAAIDAASVPTTAETSSLRSAPGIPIALAEFARDVTVDEVLPAQQARALETNLSDLLIHSTIGTEAPPGQSYADVVRMLDMAGREFASPDQAATAFAVLGRSLGLPTRVVVGFREVPAGTTTVGTTDVDVWPEVLYDGVGWVAYQPAPPPDADRTPRQQPLTEVVQPPSTGDPTGTTVPPEEPDQPVDEDPRDASGWLIPLLLVLLVAAPVIWVIALALVKRQRRRRRRRGAAEPNRRVQGAWWELVDVLDEHRVPHDPSTTTAELGERARAHLNGQAEDVAHLAVLVDACRFGALEPEPAEADQAWQTVDACRRHLRTNQDRRQRVLSAFDPRPVLSVGRPAQTRRPPRNRQ